MVEEITAPYIELSNPKQINDLDDFAAAVFNHLAATNSFFRKPSESNALYYFPDGRSDPIPVDQYNFYSLLHNLVSFKRWIRPETGGDPYLVDCVLEERYVKILYGSRRRQDLPSFEIVLREPAVFLDPAGRPFVSRPGYDDATQTFSLESANGFHPLPGVTHLKRCFSGVPFATPRFLANVIAYLLGAIVYSRSIESPLLAITGNQPGIGKTKLASSIGYILTGSEPTPVSWRGEEMNKQISALFRQGKRFIPLDNVTTKDGEPFQSPELAIHLTSGHSKSVRELGHSRNIGMQGVQFVLTANHCALHEDLAVRALMVRLHREELDVMVPYVLDQAYSFRKEIYGELLALALSTPSTAAKPLEDQFFRFRGWANFVKPRLAADFEPLELATGVIELDQDFFYLSEWLAEDKCPFREKPFTAGELLPRLTEIGLHDLNARLHGKLERSRSKSLSTFLTRFCGKSCTVSDAIVSFHAGPSDTKGTRTFTYSVRRAV